jgi:hypothetical protein
VAENDGKDRFDLERFVEAQAMEPLRRCLIFWGQGVGH